MKISNGLYGRLVLMIFAFAILFSPIIPTKKAEAQYQEPSTKQYVLTAMDSVTLPGIGAAGREGVITNEGPGRLRVFFCKQGSIVRDSNKYVEIPSGKRFKYKTYGKQIHRQAIADSCLSQVIHGEDLDLGSNFDLPEQNLFENDNGLTAGTKNKFILKDKILLGVIPKNGTVKLVDKPLIFKDEPKPLKSNVAYLRKESAQLRGYLIQRRT